MIKERDEQGGITGQCCRREDDSLFVTQRTHRIDARGAECWNERRSQRYGCQKGRCRS
jgi:hypothetical protein